ncbi:hypothetical protein HPP92_011783 [Vanilla planifolia]|uniref:Ferredoxin n=1 Tax=Vanilla planifolia TaxID=51239 RepID=A0A835R201_VANPL|nr:hypothetical protein HPP92_012134 [Vanilla planifolia]KAG0483699.1 hypothetical protein HPP92_011783 [Vanilla planifolia]
MTTSLASLSVSLSLVPHKPKSNAGDYNRKLLKVGRGGGGRCWAYKVTIEHGGERRTLEVGEDETILRRALDEGLEVPHDCKLGVCMTCPARLLSGAVDQSEGMLSDDVIARGYALLCSSYPRSDCVIRTIPEDELLSLQLATAND